MCFLFSSIPRINTGHMSIVVPDGMSLVAKTPRPTCFVSHPLQLICHHLEKRTFWRINLQDDIWTSLKWDVVRRCLETHGT